MSLQIWLPLKTSLQNNGLAQPNISASGCSIEKDGGKLGECYSFTNKTDKISIKNSNISTYIQNNFSLSFWMRSNDNNDRSIYFGSYKLTDDGKCFNVEKTAANKLRIYVGAKPDWTINNFTIEDQKWIHVTIVKNNSQTSVYKNGQLIETRKHASTDLWYNVTSDEYYLGNDGRSDTTSTSFKGYLNDFRIYDHCLSQKEIDDIYHTLILHYPLKGNYNARSNLIPNGYSLNASIKRGDEGVDNFNCPSITYNNKTGTSYVDVLQWSNCLTHEPGAKYTVSFSAKSNSGTSMRLYFYNSAGNAVANSVASTGATGKSADGNQDIQLTTSWERYYVTWTMNTTSAASSKNLLFRAMPGYDVSISQVKLEKGDTATPWCPHSSDSDYLNYTIEYDESGQCNDGTIIGNLIQIFNSSRHNSYTFFDNGSLGNNYIDSKEFYCPKEQATISCWIKGERGVAGYSDYHIPFSSGINFEISLEGAQGLFRHGFVINGVREVSTVSDISTLDNQWHMLTATFDGNKIRRYKDGVLVHEVEKPGLLSGGKRKITIGNFQSNNYGNKNLCMSDVRFYATALSSAAVKDLYETSASIDNHGNLFGYDFLQENSETITKPGIISTDDYFEIIEYDGAYWVQLLHHNSHNGTVFFSAGENGYCNKPDLYSRLDLIDYFKMNDGYYEFLVLQPDQTAGIVNRWRQRHSPNDAPSSSHTIVVIEGMTAGNTYGIQAGPVANTKFSHSGTGNDWWNALGCLKAHDGGIPGFSQQVVKGSLDFYARLDDTNVSIFQKFIKQSQLLEI